MRDTKDTMAFLRKQRTTNSTSWKGLCLALQRTARGLQPVYPSALSAQNATPSQHRYYDLKDVRRGMVAFFDDPSDSNPYGHITGVAGRAEDGELLHWTNDASGPGRVSLVRHSFFEKYWGDEFQFAADWLNGYELDMPERPVKPPKPSFGGDSLREAIKIINMAIVFHKSRNHPTIVKALERDRAELQQTLKKFGGK